MAVSTAAAATITAAAFAKGDSAGLSGIALKPYWWEAAPPRDVSPPSLPATCDVAIVGSGFTGLSAALAVAKAGRKTVVLEKGVPGFGASTRNGGQIGSGNQKFRVKRLIELRGEKKAVDMLREGMRMLEYIEELISAEGIACHFRRCGRFRGAMRPEHYEGMARDMEDLRRVAGVDSFMVPKSDVHTEVGSDEFCGGSVLPNDASLHPGLYHAGLMKSVETAGGSVFGNAQVLGIAAEAGGFRVKTQKGEIHARNVIIATNGYTDGIVPELQRRIVPVGSALISTAEISEELLKKLLPKNRVYGNTNRVFYYYRAAPEERRIVWGGRVSHLGTAAGSYRHLARDMLKVFPDLSDVPITHAWDGLIGYTQDEIPHLGRTGAGIHYAIGYCGTGVSRATYFGNKIALQLLGSPEGRTSFDDLAFPSFPLQPIAKLAVPVVANWYRLRDITKL